MASVTAPKKPSVLKGRGRPPAEMDFKEWVQPLLKKGGLPLLGSTYKPTPIHGSGEDKLVLHHTLNFPHKTAKEGLFAHPAWYLFKPRVSSGRSTPESERERQGTLSSSPPKNKPPSEDGNKLAQTQTRTSTTSSGNTSSGPTLLKQSTGLTADTNLTVPDRDRSASPPPTLNQEADIGLPLGQIYRGETQPHATSYYLVLDEYQRVWLWRHTPDKDEESDEFDGVLSADMDPHFRATILWHDLDEWAKKGCKEVDNASFSSQIRDHATVSNTDLDLVQLGERQVADARTIGLEAHAKYQREMAAYQAAHK
ncbi:hypothetical protein B0T24DRAFT_681322 [Lasiosphaeria ovina]|uniref:Uncharacterized protein n=1 Tax=Lasiosphaeria ovina TaxID=92902 RepID=A0AAE0N3E9_9PEZI|nr:hypothetical protein B0T24DRAFT_681322 [Lasiosphaeria ovina]